MLRGDQLPEPWHGTDHPSQAEAGNWLWHPTDVAAGVLDEKQGQLRLRQHVLPKHWYQPTRLHAVNLIKPQAK